MSLMLEKQGGAPAADRTSAYEALCLMVRGQLGETRERVRALDRGAVSEFVGMVEACRLDALAWSALPADVCDALGSAAQRWRRAYEQSLLRNMKHMSVGLTAWRTLEEDGVPCIPMRGPFYGVTCYGDVAVRHFTDMDMLVRERDRDRAWSCLARAGFVFHHEFLSREACARHHLQWSFRHPERGVTVDLHWALDHPYKPWRISYDAVFDSSGIGRCGDNEWRRPTTAHELLMACVHAEKECRLTGKAPGEDYLQDQAKDGTWRQWCDIAAILARHGEALEWDELQTTAHAWGIIDSVVVGASVAGRIADVAVPRSLEDRMLELPAAAYSPVHHAGSRAGGLDRMMGFRTRCLRDAWGFVKRTLGSRARGKSGSSGYRGHWGVAGVAPLYRLAWLPFDACTSLFRRCLRGWRSTAALFLVHLVALGVAEGHEFGDDVPDVAAQAEALTADGTPVTRKLEIDTDADWFSCVAHPWTTTRITVTALAGGYDSTVEMLDRSATVQLMSTNTVLDGGPVVMNWTNYGPTARVYVDVGAMFQFGTGSYDIAAMRIVEDVDGDSLPDAWETYCFSNLAQTADGDFDGDGALNGNEYWMQTDPVDAGAAVRISAMSGIDPTVSVSWDAAETGWYVVEVRTNLCAGADWAIVATNRDTGTLRNVIVNPGDADTLFYRIRDDY